MGRVLATALVTVLAVGRSAATQQNPQLLEITSPAHGTVVYPGQRIAVRMTMVDPVPDLLDGPAVTTDPEALALDGREVESVASDGVTQVLLRIEARRPGEQITVTLLTSEGTESTSPDSDGALGLPGDRSFARSRVTVIAVATSRGPLAFAVYRAGNGNVGAISFRIESSDGAARN
jgi:hypothetical protein